MIYLIVYLIISAIYGFIVFINNPHRDNISTVTHIAFGTTFPFHVLMTVVALIYSIFNVNIYYVVTVNVEDQNEGN